MLSVAKPTSVSPQMPARLVSPRPSESREPTHGIHGQMSYLSDRSLHRTGTDSFQAASINLASSRSGYSDLGGFASIPGFPRSFKDLDKLLNLRHGRGHGSSDRARNGDNLLGFQTRGRTGTPRRSLHTTTIEEEDEEIFSPYVRLPASRFTPPLSFGAYTEPNIPEPAMLPARRGNAPVSGRREAIRSLEDWMSQLEVPPQRSSGGQGRRAERGDVPIPVVNSSERSRAGPTESQRQPGTAARASRGVLPSARPAHEPRIRSQRPPWWFP
ncbi:hypothetical protein BU23DRAFT_52038 [Bimuria novae-zelandiae CBS 107.79]|uniref:Uncharacterized protein n=1 Tax=Bimuria novae-zelandiae CBS 107.79 TaxID=1447943 RepID=A0A6A5UJA9_9PLEO|nr:hypothetical protein BU23DRAFT_52038 [Bimuria novae-zelandiae CBS 107.79]